MSVNELKKCLRKNRGDWMSQDKKDNVATEELVEEQVEHVEVPEVNFEQEAEKWKNEYYRVYADMENTKRRMQNEYQTLRTYAAQSIVTDLLPVIDNLERAISSNQGNEEMAKYLKGFEMIVSQFTTVLKNHGVEVIEAMNQVFDPNKHQAIATVESDKPTGVVVEEMQKGYQMNDRVIRPSLVKVSE